MQFSVEMPLILAQAGGMGHTFGAGHLEFALRYLVAGGAGKHFAISLNPFVAPPTGNRQIAGDATEAGIALHIDKEFGERVFFRANYAWSATMGGTQQRERIFRYNQALVFPASKHWNPVIELLGETDTASGRTQFTVQPEMIYFVNSHWELKLGVPVGVTSGNRSMGVRAQVAWIFGKKGSD